MKVFLKWLSFTALTLLALYFTLVVPTPFATNAVKFLIWFGFITAVLVTTVLDKIVERQAADVEGRPLLPDWLASLDTIVDLGITFALAGYGWFGYASMYLFSTAVFAVKRELIKKKRSALASEDAVPQEPQMRWKPAS